MQYPYHVCRMKSPADFIEGTLREAYSSTVCFVVGLLKTNQEIALQSLRYDKMTYMLADAVLACDARSGSIMSEPDVEGFESAKLPVVEFSPEQFELLQKGESFEYKFANEMLLGPVVKGFAMHKKKKFKDLDLETGDLKGVPIFQVGNWTDSSGRKRKFTIADLDTMVSNHQKIGKLVQPFLKLMHLNARDHKRVASMPALGWMSDLRREGGNLIADFTDVPKKVLALIKAKSYKRISAEIFPKWKGPDGTEYSLVVSAAGLLGAVHPAIPTLPDVVAKLFGEGVEMGTVSMDPFDSEEWAETFTTTGDALPSMAFYEAERSDLNDSEGGVEMSQEELTALKQEFTDFKASLVAALGLDENSDVVSGIKQLKTDAEKNAATIATMLKGEFTRQVDAIIHDAKSEGKLAPNAESGIRDMVTGWMVVATDGQMKYQHKGEDVEGTVLDRLGHFFEEMAPTVPIGLELGKDVPEAADADIPMDIRDEVRRGHIGVDQESLVLDGLVQKYMKEHKVDYITALEIVGGITRPEEPSVEAGSYGAFVNEVEGGDEADQK